MAMPKTVTIQRKGAGINFKGLIRLLLTAEKEEEVLFRPREEEDNVRSLIGKKRGGF